MDSQHRHELKTNELAESLGHLPQLMKENARFIIGVLLIAVALITWPMFNRMAKQKGKAEQELVTQSILMLDQDIYSFLQTPADDIQAQNEALQTLLINADALLATASNIANPNLSALAQIKGAQAIRTELHLRQNVDAEMLERQIQKAKLAYQNAFDMAETPTLKAMAQLGLALSSEELGQTDQAAEIYQQIVQNENFQATVMPSLAQHRLDTLADNTETFTFADVPVETDSSWNISDLLNLDTPQDTASILKESSPQDSAESDNPGEVVDQAAQPQPE